MLRPNRSGRLATHLSDPLFRTGYLLALGSGITAVLGLVFWVLAARLYSPRVIGLNAVMISTALFIANACQLGLPAVLLRDLPQAGSRTRWLMARSYLIMFGTSLAVGLVAALTAPLWSHSLGFLGHTPAWVVGFTLACAFYAIFQGQDSVITALGAPGWVPLENSLFSLAKLLLLVAIAGASPLAGPFVAWNVPAAVGALVITWMVFRRVRLRRSGATGPSQFSPRRFMQMAAANQVALVCTYVVTLLMPAVVAASTNATQAGYFFVPWSIANGVMLVAINTSTGLTVQSSVRPAELPSLTHRTLVQTLRLVVPIGLITALIAAYVLKLYGPGYSHHGTWLLRLMMLGSVPNAVYVIGEALLRIQHRPAHLMLIQGGQSIVFLVLSIWLLNRLGINGVGLAFVISQVGGAAWLAATVLKPALKSRAQPG
jgi:O-antigen/teichoic acid export membrane protein